MTFIDLSNATKTRLPDYYEQLLVNHETIILEVGKTSKNAVANALHIHPTQFSPIYSCILAYSNLVSK